jgi:hypothetical protein
MADTSLITEHMDVLSSDRKTVGKVDRRRGHIALAARKAVIDRRALARIKMRVSSSV